MNIRFLTIILHLLFALFCLFVYKKYKDKNYILVFIINILALAFDFYKNQIVSSSNLPVRLVELGIFWLVYIGTCIYFLNKKYVA
jgi:hypothetical protein